MDGLSGRLGAPQRPLLDPLRAAVAAIGAAFTAAAGLPGWAGLGRWRFACAVTGGSPIAANASSPLLIIGRGGFLAPPGPRHPRGSPRRQRRGAREGGGGAAGGC